MVVYREARRDGDKTRRSRSASVGEMVRTSPSAHHLLQTECPAVRWRAHTLSLHGQSETGPSFPSLPQHVERKTPSPSSLTRSFVAPQCQDGSERRTVRIHALSVPSRPLYRVGWDEGFVRPPAPHSMFAILPMRSQWPQRVL